MGPDFNLKVRDDWIGWTVRKRERRLAGVMDAYILGAGPSHIEPLGGILVPVSWVTFGFHVKQLISPLTAQQPESILVSNHHQVVSIELLLSQIEQRPLVKDRDRCLHSRSMLDRISEIMTLYVS